MTVTRTAKVHVDNCRVGNGTGSLAVKKTHDSP